MTSSNSNRLVIAVACAAAFGLASTWWLHQPPATPPRTAAQSLQASQHARPHTQAEGVSISAGALMATGLPGADGHPHTLAEWQGRPVVINFWATWCDPCRAELPLLSAVSADARWKDAQIIGIALDSPEAVQDFLKHKPLGFPVLIDSNSVGEALAGRLGDASGSLPFTAIVDRAGTVVETRLGPWKAGELDTRLAALLAP